MAKSATTLLTASSSTNKICSLALAVDDAGTVLLVLLLADPGGTEGAEGSKGGGTLPHGVLAVGGGNDSNLGASGGKVGDFRLQAVGQTLVHGGATREDDVLEEVAAHIDVGGGHGGPGELGHGLARLTVELRLEEKLGGLQANGTLDRDDRLIGKGVGLIKSGRARSGGELGVVVLSDEAELLLDVLDGLELGRGGKRVAGLEEELLAVVGNDAASDLHLLNGVRNGETLENGDGVSNTITGVDDETSGATIGVEGHDGLDGDIGVLDLEGFEHELHHLLSVLFGVARSLSDEDTLNLGGSDTELVVESVVPDGLHLAPVGDDTVGDGVAKTEDASLGLSLVTNVLALGGHTLHSLSLLGNTDDGGEDDAGGVITGNTGLHHTRTVVNDSDGVLISLDHGFLLLV
mmetsp:Transcript_97991/g.134759  ORF Transcript_97991/g.134759 Transcript_97991/m.134759 type:complete len:406 (+) Transcript_97991:56-1273(+)